MPWVCVRRLFDSLVQYEIGDEVPQRISDRRNVRAKYLEFRAVAPAKPIAEKPLAEQEPPVEIKKARGRPPKNPPPPVIIVPPTKDPIAVSNLSIAQLKKVIAKEKSIAVLEAMLETESRGKKRSGAINVIEIRIDQLKED